MLEFGFAPRAGDQRNALRYIHEAQQQASALRQGEPYLPFAQQFLDMVEEIAFLESSIAHCLSQGAVKARVIQRH